MLRRAAAFRFIYMYIFITQKVLFLQLVPHTQIETTQILNTIANMFS